jgi:hypothetical protein
MAQVGKPVLAAATTAAMSSVREAMPRARMRPAPAAARRAAWVPCSSTRVGISRGATDSPPRTPATTTGRATVSVAWRARSTMEEVRAAERKPMPTWARTRGVVSEVRAGSTSAPASISAW